MRSALLAYSALWTLAGSVALAQFTPVPQAFNAWAEAGDARAVPIIVSRLHEAAGRPASEPGARFGVAYMLFDAARFQLVEFGPTLAAFARRGDLTEGDVERLADAAAEYDDPAVMPLQRSLLADPLLVQPEARVKLLSALAEHGDDHAADSLAAWTLAEFRRIEPLGPEDGDASNALWWDVPRTRSPRLLEKLKAMPPLATAFGRQLETEITARCEAAQRPIDDQYAFLATATPSQKMQAGDALAVIGKIGTVDDRDRVAHCPVGPNNLMSNDPFLAGVRRTAVDQLARRYWRERTSRPTTGPAE